MNGQLAAVFPVETAQLLHDITGEVEPVKAVHQTLRDAIEHRLEKISSSISKFEAKYHLSFTKFKKQWLVGKIARRYSLSVETDYREWEGLTSRRQKLTSMLQWLP